MTGAAFEGNPYSVEVEEQGQGWKVSILDAERGVVWSRACRDVHEASLLASTVRQHVYWLSPEKFREYYRLAGSATDRSRLGG